MKRPNLTGTAIYIVFFILVWPISATIIDLGTSRASFTPATRGTIRVNGTGGSDYTKIQDAVNAAETGDTIEVDPGTYREAVTIAGKSLTIIGDDPLTTIIINEGGDQAINLQSDNNRIENIRARDSQHGIKISNSQGNVINNCHLVYNSLSGVRFSGECSFNEISSSVCSRNQYGIRLFNGCDDNTLTDNICNNNDYGIYLQNSDNNTISDNQCNENSISKRSRDIYISAGIYVNADCHGNVISDNTCNSNGEYGIFLYQSDGNTIDDNTCNLNHLDGIHLTTSDNNIIGNNSLESNEQHGISLLSSLTNVLDENECDANDGHGILVESSPFTTLTYNEINDCGLYFEGDELEDWNTHSIPPSNIVAHKSVKYFNNAFGEEISSGSYGQVILANCTNMTVRDIEANGGAAGLILAYSSSNTISESTFGSNYLHGIMLYGYCDNNVVANNTCSGNDYGIYVNDFCLANELRSNTCNSNDIGGIFLASHSNDQVLTGNICNENSVGLLVSSSSNTIRENSCILNSGNGIHFKEGSSGNTVEKNTFNENEHGLYMENTASNTIEDNECDLNNRTGIYVDTTNVGSILKNSCSGNGEEGIRVGGSATITLEENEAGNNSYGVIIVESDHCTVYNNRFVFNDLDGIVLSHSATNTVSTNVVKDNGEHGIRLWAISTFNTIERNILEDNGGHGVYIDTGSSNIVRFNNFLANNANQVQAKDNGSSNIWDDNNGEGNYWSDYAGRYSGASLDGKVWDTPYDIDGSAGAKDRYPLHQSYDLIPPHADAGPDVVVDEGVPFTFDSSRCSDDKSIENYTWVFLYDEVTKTIYGPSPIFTFEIVMSYTVTLRVTDTGGNWAEDTIFITVRDVDAPVIVTGGDVTINPPKTHEIDASGSYDNVGIVNYTWEYRYLNDTKIRYESVFSFKFEYPGVYTFTLTILDAAGNKATDVLTITVRDIERPRADAGKDISGMPGDIIYFNGEGSTDDVGIVKYVWTFTDNGSTVTLDGPKASHRFDDEGIYKVRLRVFDAWDNNRSDEITVTIGDPGPDDDDDNDDIGPDDDDIGPDDDDIGPDDDDSDGEEGDPKGMSTTTLIALGAGILFIVLVIVILVVVVKGKARKKREALRRSDYDDLYGAPSGRKTRRRDAPAFESKATTADELDDSWMSEVMGEDYSEPEKKKVVRKRTSSDGRGPGSRRVKRPSSVRGKTGAKRSEGKKTSRGVKKRPTGRAAKYEKKDTDKEEKKKTIIIQNIDHYVAGSHIDIKDSVLTRTKIEVEEEKGLDIEKELGDWHDEMSDEEEKDDGWNDGDDGDDDTDDDSFKWADDDNEDEGDEEEDDGSEDESEKDIYGYDDDDDEWEV